MTLAMDNWDKEYENKRVPALRLVGSVESQLRSLLGLTTGRLPRHPLLSMMTFYWYERTLQVRKEERRHVDTGWMTEYCFGRDEQLGWFAELADCLIISNEDLPQEPYFTQT